MGDLDPKRERGRVYMGTDPETGQRWQVTRTVRGSRTQAERELRNVVALANVAPTAVPYLVSNTTSTRKRDARWLQVM